MSRLYIDSELAVGGEIRIGREQNHYLQNVLRLKPGAVFFLFNGRDGLDYRASLSREGKTMVARIDSALARNTESGLNCQIIQGLGRADHMDWMIQKTTELGVKRISLFGAARSQGRLQPAQLDKKMRHWRGVAISAAEQCGRAILPQIDYFPDLDSVLRSANDVPRLLLDFDGAALAQVLPTGADAVAVLLGPEGGLTEAEIDLARNSGFEPARLGPRVLRTETAATAALALLQSALGDL